ncbi:hypothetical protein [Enterococcus mundtii]|uniref:hypothetical protein n=1 Tax=Enterococcus mundtii TaxID=53346 RepID=UPI001CF230D8|nr:hypothetical protein [Enterococcus mundtii]MCA6775341.1 hypothetical protein [Enterococcus mundtii]
MKEDLFYLKLIDLCMTQSWFKRRLYRREIRRLINTSIKKNIPLNHLIDRRLGDLLGEVSLCRSDFSFFYHRIEFYKKLSDLFD